ncbi:cohesin subunit SMC1 [Sugiyamaella lignohabitans]|uniref:Structural maintenance of chromosomes protein n=1 Tax=Sugiyamaella lignohabitans TaxID=796027 RepID=A0A167CA43_9ASCO|nr:cohesin subunit SMC1 [Sugiyamaella lignohabitans]ANB11416.1 cohesin subunit SMC1 [Sugiyamaella lignohabitans]
MAPTRAHAMSNWFMNELLMISSSSNERKWAFGSLPSAAGALPQTPFCARSASFGQKSSNRSRVRGTGSGRRRQSSAAASNTGTSEYFINDKRVAEKEYQDTLAAENIIVKAKNFLVFQGDVEKTAAMKPSDLATLIERVSGSIEFQKEYDELQKELEVKGRESIVAYQKRKEYNAEVKQYQTQTTEVENYNKKIEERDNLKTNLILWKLYHIERDISSKKEQIKAFDEEIQQKMDALTEAEEILANANSAYATANNQYRSLERKHHQYVKKIESRQKDVLPINEKIKLKKHHVKEAESRLAAVQHDLDRQNGEIAIVQKGFEVLDKAVKKFEVESKQSSALSGLRDVSDEVIKEYEALNSDYKLRTSAEQSRLETLLRNKRTNTDKLVSLTNKRDEAKAKVAALQSEIADLKSSIKHISESINDDNESVVAKKSQLDKIISERSDKQRNISELNSQLATVARQLLDYNTSVRESEKTIKLKEDTESLKRLFPGVKGLISDLLEPKERRYQTAVSTVLGRNFDSIVVDSQKTARECIEYLKEQRKGTCSFIPLDTIVVTPIPSSMRTLGRNVRLAIETVSFKPEIERAVQFVCSNSLICDNIEVAKEMKWSRNIQAMMVCLDGSIIHRANMISGGTVDNRNARRWEQKDVVGMYRLKDKLTNDLRQLTMKKNENSTKEESLISEIGGLEMKLQDSRDRLNTLNITLESRQSELQHHKTVSREVVPTIGETEKTIAEYDDEINKIESKVKRTRQSIFGDLCARMGISDIKEFETAQSSHLELINKKNLEFSSQRTRLQTRLNFETGRAQQTQKRVDNIRVELERNQEVIKQLRSEREVILTEISQLEADKNSAKEKSEEAKAVMEARKATAEDYVKVVHENRNDLSRAEKKQSGLEEDISRDAAKRLDMLTDCKINGQTLPLLEGSLNDIPMKRMLSEGDGDDLTGNDGDGDVSMADAVSTGDIPMSQISDTSVFGILVDYSRLEERLKESSDPAIETEIEEEIGTLSSQIDGMVVNVRASDHLEEASTKFKEAASESEQAGKTHRAIRKKFEEVKRKRSTAFNKAFDQISRSIDGIYKELTRNKSFPTGGSANLYWENDGDDFAKGIIYNVQPPMKQFCEIEQLSGGEKTMAALALLFAIHRFHPSPFFILDEIDAALDNNNIASIGRYIKHNARENFQFIVISLKNGLFEKSDALVGIYRDQDINSSRALTLDLRQFDNKPAPSDTRDRDRTPAVAGAA